ncbi:hypothetical protein ACFQ36_02765 [Arthrobacter sp. GCM10027362]|uniref:hypothetical protein n=1 Tax=Arthrobacter sp. GCM10027362 TaxID=3273379 RepID=UPI00363D0F8C
MQLENAATGRRLFGSGEGRIQRRRFQEWGNNQRSRNVCRFIFHAHRGKRMSTNQQEGPRPGLPRRKGSSIASMISAAALAVVAGAAPLALAEPAQASTTYRSCTVTPKTPGYNYRSNRVDYYFVTACSGGRTISVQQRYWEDDGNKDQYLGSKTHPSRYYPQYRQQTWHSYYGPPNTESGPEEVYYQIRFRVYRNGTWSAWTAWESSGVLTINQP